MSSLAVLAIFLGVPACVGYVWPRYTAFLIPVFLLGLSIASHVDNLSSASHPDDEVNGIPASTSWRMRRASCFAPAVWP